mmetsp:Transcript_19114/g.40156  ORF Transcript_19114/g.40156 Transcript_19114/m.40156 type:complete len:188 (-) Transcript_19114:946-1509(-)
MTPARRRFLFNRRYVKISKRQPKRFHLILERKAEEDSLIFSIDPAVHSQDMCLVEKARRTYEVLVKQRSGFTTRGRIHLRFNGGIQTLADDIDHGLEVFVVPHQGKSNVAGPGEHLGSQRQGILGGSKSPVDEVSGVGLVTKELHWKSVFGALVQELLDLLISDFVREIELKRIVNWSHPGSIRGDG